MISKMACIFAVSSLTASAHQHKHHHVKNLIQLQDDPRCSSADIDAGCVNELNSLPTTKPPYPMDYPVPNFGMDEEIATSIKNSELAQKEHNHDWVIPDKKSLPPPPPMNYFVPNFGLDKEIIDNQKDISVAEKIVKHHWEWDDRKLPKPSVLPFY